MKNLFSFHLTKGDIVEIRVGSPTGYPRFLPVFLSSGKDGHVLKGERSIRLAQLAWGEVRPSIKDGEKWQAKVVAVKVDYKKTKDGRCRVIVYLANFQRIERIHNCLIGDEIGYKEVWSGERLITKQRVNLYLRKSEFLYGNKILVIYSYYNSSNGELFTKKKIIYPKKVIIDQLREAHIDVSRYFKQLPKWDDRGVA